jgi:hypothetical protein
MWIWRDDEEREVRGIASDLRLAAQTLIEGDVAHSVHCLQRATAKHQALCERLYPTEEGDEERPIEREG